MTQDLFQEVTGIKLQPEKEEYLTSNEFAELPAYNNITKENTIWEFYFVPEEITGIKQYAHEDYLVSVSTEEDTPCITLKKRSKFGDFINEHCSFITKQQFRELLLENYEWMKHSGELLLLELYNKFTVWKMKVGIFLECLRKSILFPKEKVLVTVDTYRAIPGNTLIASRNPLYRQMAENSYRVTVKDLCSNYSGMNCLDIVHSLSHK